MITAVPVRRASLHARTMAFAACLCAVLGACVSTPMPDMDVALPSRWQHATASGDRPSTLAWWEAFDDPRLDALERQALASNLDVAESAARLRAARASSRAIGAGLRPDLHLRTSDPVDPDASASYIVVGFDSTWELGLFGRNAALHRIAEGSVQDATAQLRDAQVSLTAEVARQWLLLRGARQAEVLHARIRDARMQQARRMDERQQLALASPSDAAQARAALAQARMAQAEPVANAAAAAQALATLLGRSEPDPAWLQPETLQVLHEPWIDSTPADLLRVRPDIARAQAAVLTAAGEAGIAKADRYPNVGIGGSLVWSTSEAQRINTDTGTIGSFGPLIDIPLFDWGMRRARADAKGELLQAAALAYRQRVLVAAGEVETALATLEQGRQREQAGEQALQSLDAVASGTLRRHQLGLASGIDVAASDAERAQAALDLNAARTSRSIDYIALCKALGGGWQAAPGAAH